MRDNGAYGLLCVQGTGQINGQPLNSPKLIRFTELTEDEYFCTEDGAESGVTFENTSETEPLVCIRYFGPEVNPDAPADERVPEGQVLRSQIAILMPNLELVSI